MADSSVNAEKMGMNNHFPAHLIFNQLFSEDAMISMTFNTAIVLIV